MAPQSSRRNLGVPLARRLRKNKFVSLRCGQLEDRIAPALFNVQTPLNFNGLSNNGCVAVADLNKDGHMDAVLSNFGTGYGTEPAPFTTIPATKISVLYGNGSGGFSTSMLLDTGSKNTSFVSIADINGDSWLDVVASSANQQNAAHISIFKNTNGSLSLAPGSPISSGGNNTSWVGMADTTGDGVLDLVAGSFGKVQGDGDDATITGNNISIFQGNGDFTFSSNPVVLRPEIQFVPIALAVADFDGDNDQDIAAVVPGVPPDFGQPYPNGSIYVFAGNGSGGFGTPNQYDTGGVYPVNIQAADVSGDGKKDLIVANAGDPYSVPEFKGTSVGVVLNASSGGTLSFGFTNALLSNTYGTFAVAAADLDVDGKVDIAAVNYGSQETSPDAFVSFYKGNGTGGFATGSPGTYDTLTGLGGGQYLAVGDFDESGTPDLIVAHASNKVGMLINTMVLAPSVTINQGSSQVDPTNAPSIVFDVVFSEGVTGFTSADVDLSGSSMSGLTPTVTPVSSSVYTVSVTGMTTAGTVKASIPAAAATSITNSTPTTASTSTDNQVTFDNVTPTVTINQANGQVDPTTTGPILFSVVFSENVTGFGNNDVDLSESSIGGLSATVTQNTPSTYTVSVTGMTGNGTVIANVLAGAATDSAGNTSAISTSTDNTVTFGNAPSVTINQGSSQLDPTNSSSIVFDVVFSEGVSGFTNTDVDLSGSSVSGLSAAVTQISSTLYTVAVSGMAGTGTVKATIPAGAATSIAGSIPTVASSSTDNQVGFDLVVPTVTINQANGQADPTTTGPILFTVVFSENVAGFAANDIDLSLSSLSGLSASVTENTPSNYTVSVTGMTGNGTVIANVLAGAATDSVGNASAASTSTDNAVVHGDITPPSVTINQAVGQADPTNVSSISFDVKFSEPVLGFGPGDVNTSSSTVGGTLSVNVTGSLDTYTVTVTGMTTSGLVIATIPAGGATDAAGNANLVSTSTDNSVEFLNTGSLGFSKVVFDTVDEATDEGPDPKPRMFAKITVTRSGQTDGAVSIKYATSDGTAHSGGRADRGQADYIPTSEDENPDDTLRWADGDGGDREFTIEILRDTFNEGKELINLELTGALGNPVLGITEATVAIAPSDGQGPGVSRDQDNDKVTIRLNGKTGSLLYYRTDPDGDSRGPIELIELTGTLPDPRRPKSSLVITVAKDKTSPGDGVVGLGAITGSGLRSISARKANLNLEGIDLNGYLGSLVIGNILNGADITTLGTTNSLQKTRINALSIGDDTTINVDNAIANLTAIRVGAGEIIADSIGAMVVRGQFKPAVVGDMASDITLSGDRLPVGRLALGALVVTGSIPDGADIVAPSVGRIFVKKNLDGDVTVSGVNIDPAKRALGLLRVVGAVSNSDIKVGGNVGAAVVGAFRNSRLFAGYVGPDTPDPNGFNLAAKVNVFRSTGKVDGFQNSRVFADKFGFVTINNLVSSNSNYFGFYADTSLGAINVMTPERFTYDPTLSAPQGIDEFEVVVI